MSKKLKITKSIISGIISVATALSAGAGLAASAAGGARIDTPAVSSAVPAFVGGVRLHDDRAVILAPEPINLAQIAEYGHLFASMNSDDAVAQEVDPMETGSIIAGVFHSIAIPIRSFPVAKRWVRIMQGITECGTPGACTGKSQILSRISTETEGKTLREKVRIVNSIVNNTLRYRGDQSLYGKLDYWATPAEILARASGDCEDFAILKMTGMIRAGVPANSLSVVVLRDNGRGVFHAVLAVTTSAGSFILDNARVKVAMDADLPNYQPLYSLSENRAWIHGSKAADHNKIARNEDFASIAPGEGFVEADQRGDLRPSLPAFD